MNIAKNNLFYIMWLFNEMWELWKKMWTFGGLMQVDAIFKIITLIVNEEH
jgi:hypothetical protein